MSTVRINNTIPVWINAGDKAITLSRCDRAEWQKPLFVNAPTGVREALVQRLAKGPDGKATRNIRWEMPESALIEQVIQSGPNMGGTCWVVKIQVAPETAGAVALDAWLQALEISRRGAVDPQVKSVLDAWLADGDEPF